MDRRLIHTYPIAPLVRSKLYKAGYRCIADFKHITAEQLTQDCSVTEAEAKSVLQTLKQPADLVSLQAGVKLVEEEEKGLSIMTFSEQLDTALDGGIKCGQLTEISGLPGCGKTQLCLQLLCAVQIECMYGGLDGEVLYIDTNVGLVIDRLIDIVTATLQHCHHIQHTQGELTGEVSMEKMLSRIHIQRCKDRDHLLAVIHTLPLFLNLHTKVRLVVIDSISSYFRCECDDMIQRTRILTNVAQMLKRVACQYNIAVVITNQLTTRVHQGSDKGSHLVACLGESWGHACTNRIMLEQDGGTRRAWLMKVTGIRQTKLPFLITRQGIRDVTGTQTDNVTIVTNDGDCTMPPSKRQRIEVL